MPCPCICVKQQSPHPANVSCLKRNAFVLTTLLACLYAPADRCSSSSPNTAWTPHAPHDQCSSASTSACMLAQNFALNMTSKLTSGDTSNSCWLVSWKRQKNSLEVSPFDLKPYKLMHPNKSAMFAHTPHICQGPASWLYWLCPCSASSSCVMQCCLCFQSCSSSCVMQCCLGSQSCSCSCVMRCGVCSQSCSLHGLIA